jgi:SAM-dependent methyltransferase
VLKAFLRRGLRKAGWDLRRLDPGPLPSTDPIALYERSGSIPWSPGYQEMRDLFVEKALADESLLERFRRDTALPPDYGIGVDERVVEYPWMYARLPAGAGRVLDAGGVLNYGFLVAHPLMRPKKVHVVTLVPEGRCRCVDGVSHIYEDLRSMPVSSGFYDTVVCLSTLEHIGMDNTMFRAGAEDAPEDYAIAVREMRRVLNPGGALLLTVPFGAYRHFGSFQLFDGRLIDGVVAAFAPSRTEETYFRYSARGWSRSDRSSCATAEYVPWIMQPPHERPVSFPVQPDRAAAARAVACLELVR